MHHENTARNTALTHRAAERGGPLRTHRKDPLGWEGAHRTHRETHRALTAPLNSHFGKYRYL